MILTYLEQIRQAADAAGVSIADACARAGLAHSTYWRWTTQGTTPTAEAAASVLKAIEDIKTERANVE